MAERGAKLKTLKDLKRETPGTNEVMQRLALAQQAPDYEAVMLSTALAEFMLTQAISTKFISLTNAERSAIFDDAGHGPLSSFSAKIRITYALGIVSQETKSQLLLVKEIRNHFAHATSPASFENEVLAREGCKLKRPKVFSGGDLEHIVGPKLRLVQTCFYISIEISNHVQFIGTDNAWKFPIPIDCF